MIYILVLFLFCFLGLMYTTSKDILRPSIGICGVFLISVLSAVTNINIWKFSISTTCVFVVLGAVVIYGIVDFCMFLLKKNNHKFDIINGESICEIEIDRESICEIEINNIKFCGLVVLMIISCILYYKDIIYISSKYGISSSWFEMIRYYRNGSMTGAIEEGISSMASNAYILSTAIAYIFMYIFVHNLVVNKKGKKNYLNLIPIIIFFINTLFTGGRMPLLRLIIGAIFLFIYLKSKISRKNGFNLKSFFKVLIFVTIILWGFASISTLVGRTYDGNALYYVTSYAGGSIPLLDLFLKEPVSHDIWGYETFPSILKFIGRHTENIQLSQILVNKEFRVLEGYNLGNVYTALRAYISDFGYCGMIILTGIHAIIYSGIYNILCSKSINWGKVDFSILFYTYIVHAIYLFSIDDRFYMDLCSITTIKMLILLWGLNFVMNGIQVERWIIKIDNGYFLKHRNKIDIDKKLRKVS